MILTVFAVKYTYFKPQNILINPQNILMISYTYQAKFCHTTPEYIKYIALHCTWVSVPGDIFFLYSFIFGLIDYKYYRSMVYSVIKLYRHNNLINNGCGSRILSKLLLFVDVIFALVFETPSAKILSYYFITS